jgi:sucrose phosphorylase
MPGVPQVYYVGLLAGENDLGLLARSGVGRDINRHHYGRGEIGTALQQPVVARLLQLIRVRNEHPAFGGAFTLLASDAATLALRWSHGAHSAELQVDLRDLSHRLTLSDGAGGTRELPLV